MSDLSNDSNGLPPLPGQISLVDALNVVRMNDVLCEECKALQAMVVVGQGFTGYTCVECEERYSYHNTWVPKMCKPCAIDTISCRRCLKILV